MDTIKALDTWPLLANEELVQEELDDGERQRSSLRSPRSGTVNPNPVRSLYVPRIYTMGPQVGNDTLLYKMFILFAFKYSTTPNPAMWMRSEDQGFRD